MNNKITIENAVQLMKSTDGQIFSVEFEKKDGTIRQMNCRTGVKKGVKGVGLAYDPQEYDLMTVFDLQKNSFRMINTSTLRKVTFKGQTYAIVQ